MDADQIPAAMVEAAAQAVRERLDDLGTEGRDEEGTLDGSLWLDGLDAVAEDLAATALAAALGVCQVHAQWGYRSHWADGTGHDMWEMSRESAEWTIRGATAAIPRSLIHRLVITTPAQPVTEGEKPT